MLMQRLYRLFSTKCQQDPIAKGSIYITHLPQTGQAHAYIDPLPLPVSFFDIRRYSTCSQWRNINTNSVRKFCINNGLLPARYARTMVAKRLWEQPPIILFDLRHTPSWNLYRKFLAQPRTRHQIAQRPRVKPNTTGLKEKETHTNEH